MCTKVISPLRIILAVLLTAAVVLVSASPASAGSFDPVYRGDDNSVHAIFDWVSFEQSNWTTTLFEQGPSIYQLDDAVPSASDDGITTTIILPNFIDPLPLKLMRIQMSFEYPRPGDLVSVDLIASDPLPTGWNVVGSSGPGEATEHYIDIEIWPNPDSEQIMIIGTPAGGTPGDLLTVELDTVSLPEPTTILLFALGGVILRRKRKA